MRTWLIPALVVAALLAAWLDGDSGIRAWMSLRADVQAAEGRLADLRGEIGALEREALALESDAFAQERAIREELEWARPGETVVRMPPETGAALAETPRFP